MQTREIMRGVQRERHGAPPWVVPNPESAAICVCPRVLKWPAQTLSCYPETALPTMPRAHASVQGHRPQPCEQGHSRAAGEEGAMHGGGVGVVGAVARKVDLQQDSTTQYS